MPFESAYIIDPVDSTLLDAKVSLFGSALDIRYFLQLQDTRKDEHFPPLMKTLLSLISLPSGGWISNSREEEAT